MKVTAIALLLTCLALEGCCTSLMCKLTTAAKADLQCNSDQLNVENQSQPVRGQPARVLRVAGCGRVATYRCEPTNLAPEPAVKVRGKEIERQTTLDLHWQCAPASAEALQTARR